MPIGFIVQKKFVYKNSLSIFLLLSFKVLLYLALWLVSFKILIGFIRISAFFHANWLYTFFKLLNFVWLANKNINY
ncbi:hypothetical protein SAMN04488089_12219 [Myroides profundi]|uniref:Uncharacterized protein n=1 Tax=Myroides profundi TaxID=480520 RepID=A0AAJ5BFG7_MYRPR|nr:hypothetical protein SAMN04488089_12219 [Myroides profundi]